MKRQLELFVILVLLASLGGWTVVGQEVSTLPINCEEFKLEGGVCKWESSVFLPVTFGRGWKTTMTASAKAEALEAGVVLNTTPEQWKAGLWSVPTYFQAEGFGSGSGVGMTLVFKPGQTGVILLQPAKGCDEHGQNCLSLTDPETTISGLVRFGLIGSPKALREADSPVLTMENLETGVILSLTLQKPKPPAPATIVATPSSGSVNVSWVSTVGGPIVRVYRNGEFLWNQTCKGTETDWGVPAGTHQYCVRGVDADWKETGDLACSTAVVQ